jgi:transcriptional regulator with PAS, ATPase and Fis domain
MMKMDELVLIAGAQETRMTLHKQLEEVLGDFVKVKSYSLEEQIPFIDNQIVVLSSALLEDEVVRHIGKNCRKIIANRMVNYHNIDRLLMLPERTQALYITDFPQTTMDSIESLKQLGIDHIEFHPYYPGIKDYFRTEIAIKPRTALILPDVVKEVIHIGPRLIDFTTILFILETLGLSERIGRTVSEKFTHTLLGLSKRIAEAYNLNTKSLNLLLDGIHDNAGILEINYEGKISVFNEQLEKILNIPRDRAFGENIRNVFYNTQLVNFIFNSSSREKRSFVFSNAEVIVHRFHFQSAKSIVALFKKTHDIIKRDRTTSREFIRKGYVAKYTFEDIIGTSPILQSTIHTAKKLAKSDLTILIEGESGTGKELFASAIHNESLRCNGPFLAVNFSALSEDLVESELFGYEGGSFTGARAEGKAGLFEQANGGTIFLDEIGDVSLKLQARLLRILQEKEIMRVGGSKIIPVDVRVIAATNKDLLRMIELGTFREDLYYRLKILFIHLPELRNRKQDIPRLINHFIKQSNNTNVQIQTEVVHRLVQYQWYGNIRELKNTIDYMITVCEDYRIDTNSLPDHNFFQKERKSLTSTPMTNQAEDPNLHINEEEIKTILQAISSIIQSGEPAGRKKISQETQNHGPYLTEQQIRQRLEILQIKGYIIKSKGRAGTKLTDKGINFLEER